MTDKLRRRPPRTGADRRTRSMTDIEKKALALLNEVNIERNRKGATFVFVDRSSCVLTEALCRAIEQHEAFRQEVSDALEKRGFYIDDRDLGRFIITKPDPLVEAIKDAWPEASKAYGEDNVVETAETLRAALAKRGGKIVFDD